MLSRVSKMIPQVLRQNAMRAFSSGIQTSRGAGSDVDRYGRLQFSKDKLVDFGELPLGEIPDALKFDRPNTLTKLDNGVRLATETFTGTHLVTLGFYWSFGTRSETQATSGLCNFMQRLQYKGTHSRTASDISSALQALGGCHKTILEREKLGFQITVEKQNVAAAIDLFSDMMQNSTFTPQQVDAEREGVLRSIVELQRDQLETTLESLWYTSYREHQMGQPVRGSRDNVGNITSEALHQFVGSNCVGNNLVVVASGDCTEADVLGSVGGAFGGMPQSAGQLANMDKPIYTASLMFMRDDEMANMNIAVFFNAPSYTNEDYWAFTLLNKLMCEYREDRHTGMNLNAVDRQYSTWHKWLGNLPDISITKPFYFPGSDGGLWGNYLHGNEVHGAQMCFGSQNCVSEFSYELNQAEIFRIRGEAWNELLNHNSGSMVNDTIATEVVQWGRRMPRSENAIRVSNVADMGHMKRVITEWIWDRDISGAVWGPMHGMAGQGHYNRSWRRSTLGWYGRSQFDSQ